MTLITFVSPNTRRRWPQTIGSVELLVTLIEIITTGFLLLNLLGEVVLLGALSRFGICTFLLLLTKLIVEAQAIATPPRS